MRPLLVVDQHTGELVYTAKHLSTTDPEVLFAAGALELVDPYEQEGLKIATSVEDLLHPIPDAVSALVILINDPSRVYEIGIPRYPCLPGSTHIASSRSLRH